MALKRILPCLLYNGKGLVKTIQFKNPGYVGDPINAIKIFNEKEVDELVVLDINATKEQRGPNFSKIADMAGEAFMPFAYGGGVKTYEDFVQLFKLGIETVNNSISQFKNKDDPISLVLVENSKALALLQKVIGLNRLTGGKPAEPTLINLGVICEKILQYSTSKTSTTKYNFYQMFFDEVLRKKELAYA